MPFLYLMLALAGALLLQVQLASRFTIAAALFLATASVVCCLIDIVLSNRKQFGSKVPLPLAFCFLLFLTQFNVVRGFVYAFLHDDNLLIKLGAPDPDWLIGRALIWTALFVLSFGVSYRWTPLPNWALRLCDAIVIFRAVDPVSIYRNRSAVLLMSFAVTLGCVVLMILFSVMAGGVDLSTKVSSAYVYMLPLVSYGLCLSLYGGMMATARDGKFMWIFVLLCLFAVIAYFGRTVSQFRIYSITLPALVIGYHFAQKRRLLAFFAGVMLVFPLITHLGRNRGVGNQELATSIMSTITDESSGQLTTFLVGPYMSDGGDFTTVDIFASVLKQEPHFYPYGLSWLYAIVHFIPRQIWASKPENGILYDTSYSVVNQKGDEASIPYTPGVVGDAYLEGGPPFVFLIGAMFGFAFKLLDTVLGRRRRLFGATIDYCAIYSAFFFVAFFANRSLPFFIVLYTAINLFGIFVGRSMLGLVSRQPSHFGLRRPVSLKERVINPLPKPMKAPQQDLA